MSMNFRDPIDGETKTMIREMFGDSLVDIDDRTALFNKGKVLLQSEFKKITNKAKQPVEVELNDIDDIKAMSDGSEYKCSIDGWIKIK